MTGSIRKSRLARGLSLSKLGAKLALKQGKRLIGSDPTDLHRDVASALVKELGELKGLPMKIGQILSYMDGVVPDEYRDVYQDILGQLRTDSPPMAASTSRQVIEEELGAPVDEIFEEFEDQPIASASIGQVHRAVHQGRPVCVKVQYPGIANATLSDLENIDLVVRLMRQIMPTVDTQQMIEDFRARLAEECDYRIEARYQTRFAAIYESDPDLYIPRVIEEASAARVLTTELARGEKLETFAQSSTQEERDRAGMTLFRFAFGTLLQHGLFHADPHPGNLLFRSDEGRLCVLDFGCVQPIEPDARRDIGALFHAAVAGRDLGDAAGIALGITDMDTVTRDAVAQVTELALSPVTAPQPYRFTRDFAGDISRAMVDAKMKLATRFATRRARFSAHREGVMFVARNVFGLAAIWGTLGSQGDFRALAQSFMPQGLPEGVPSYRVES